MRRTLICLSVLLTLLLTATLFAPSSAYLFSSKGTSSPKSFQNSTLKIIDVKSKKPPVINENKQVMLAAIDSRGQIVTDVTFSSDSPDIARIVDPARGIIQGVTHGYATITVTRANRLESREFAVVTRVNSGRADKLTGGRTSPDNNKLIYLSNPVKHMIFTSDITMPRMPPKMFAGTGVKGIRDGNSLRDAQFNGPLGIAVDNRDGAVYIADTLNNCIRRVKNGTVTTVLGSSSGTKGVPNGLLSADKISFTRADDIQLDGPQGVEVDSAGRLYVNDTNNNAIYVVDFSRREIRLLAGAPGQPGDLRDGKGRDVRFRQPNGIKLSNDRVLQIIDTGNNLLRTLDTQTGEILPNNIGTRLTGEFDSDSLQASTTGIPFNGPTSVSTDAAGNIYVIDRDGAQIVTFPDDKPPLVLPLAQPGEITSATSIAVRGTQAFVIDEGASNLDETLKTVTVGSPKIDNVTPNITPLSGGVMVTITGSNFAPDSQVTVGDRLIDPANLVIVDARHLRVVLPSLTFPGDKTLTVITRGGTDQKKVTYQAKRLDEIANGQITTVAGASNYLGDGGLAASDNTFLSANNITVDSAGNLFIADFVNNRVRRVDANTQIITTVAGNGIKASNGDGDLALVASLANPSSVAIDSNGNIIIADRTSATVRSVDVITGKINKIVGSGRNDFNLNTDENVPALNTGIEPTRVIFDQVGNLLIADIRNRRVRRVDAITKIIATIAGNGSSSYGGDGLAAISTGIVPSDIAIDSNGDLFIADNVNHRILQVQLANNSRIITTIAGTGTAGSRGDGSQARQAELNQPGGLAIDTAGNIFIADTANHVIRFVDRASGVIRTVVGNGTAGFSDNIAPTSAQLSRPADVAVDGGGNIFIADEFNFRIRRVDNVSNTITTVAGSGSDAFRGDNVNAISSAVTPNSIVINKHGELIIADSGNESSGLANRVRNIGTNGIITTIAGTGCNQQFNNCPFNENVPATTAGLMLYNTAGAGSAAVDKEGNIFIADIGNHCIRRVDAQSSFITIVTGTRSPDFGGDNGPAINAKLSRPAGVAIDQTGNLYIADTGNNRIRRVDATTKIITTVAGPSGLNNPERVAIDNDGNVLIADLGNNVVRRVDIKTGGISTIAGDGTRKFVGDNSPATKTGLNPRSVTVDSKGNIFIADGNNFVLRLDVDTGLLNIVAGNGSAIPSGDGGVAVNAGIFPRDIAIDNAGNLYIVDSLNGSIRVVKNVTSPSGPIVPMITNAGYNKPNLSITGTGFGQSGASVRVNGTVVDSFISSQSDSLISIVGKKKPLGIKKGANQVTVTVNGVTSNTFVFQFFAPAAVE